MKSSNHQHKSDFLTYEEFKAMRPKSDGFRQTADFYHQAYGLYLNKARKEAEQTMLIHTPIFVLYGGSSPDGRGNPKYLGKTSDAVYAHKYWKSIKDDPYSCGQVRALLSTTEIVLNSETAWAPFIKELIKSEKPDSIDLACEMALALSDAQELIEEDLIPSEEDLQRQR